MKRGAVREPHQERVVLADVEFSRFSSEEDQLLLGRVSFPSRPSRLWLIDGDDTLWEDNLHYDELILRAHTAVLRWKSTLSLADFKRIVDLEEEQTLPVHGYGPGGFAIALRAAMNHILDNLQHDEIDSFHRGILPYLTNVQRALLPGVVESLVALSASPKNALVLATMGSPEIQLEKIRSSGLAEHFHGIAIMRHKDPKSWEQVARTFGGGAVETVVIGNSMEHEVKPAVSLGWTAVHFRNPNSWEKINAVQLDSSRYRSISGWNQVVDLDD